jgi:nicotinamidase-related amidase
MHAGARGGAPTLRYTVPGTRGHEFVGELAPVPGELVVSKYRSSAFWGTNLELLLRSNGIQTVVVGGCTTEGCVESTARDAMFADHYVVIADDCVGSDDKQQHDASMLLMSHRFDMASGSRIAAVWQAAGADEPDNSKKRRSREHRA